jgi:hypothetical protein
MNIGQLRTRKMLSLQMRQVFKWDLCEANNVYRGRKRKLFTHILLQEDGKASLSLCGRAVSHLTFGKMKLQLKSESVRLI